MAETNRTNSELISFMLAGSVVCFAVFLKTELKLHALMLKLLCSHAACLGSFRGNRSAPGVFKLKNSVRRFWPSLIGSDLSLSACSICATLRTVGYGQALHRRLKQNLNDELI
jgi:hypothetical protein